MNPSRPFAARNSFFSKPSPFTNVLSNRNALKSCLQASSVIALTGGLTSLGGIPLVGMSSSIPPSIDPRNTRTTARSNRSNHSIEPPNDSQFPLTLTNSLILFNGILYAAQVISKDVLTIWGAKVNSMIVAGQWWRLITPAFLHGNLMHLAVNCYSLYNLAPLVETLSGSKRLAAIYLVAAVTGNVASFYGSASASLGASGAVFGVGGALGMYFYRNKKFYGKKADYVLKQLWQTLLLNMVYGLSSPRIDNWGHIGGLFGGALAAYLLGPRFKVANIEGRRGQYLLDEPPIPLLASPPRLIK